MPSMEDVHVDPTAASGSSKISTPVSQDPALHDPLMQPTAADEAEGEPTWPRGQPTYAPLSSRVYTNIQRSRRVACKVAA